MGIVDAQSVKNTESAREKGYDAGKKVSGIKRHIIVDTNGLPHATLLLRRLMLLTEMELYKPLRQTRNTFGR